MRWSRVRIVDYPLAEYTEFELHGYRANAAAGETIHVANRQWHRALAELNQDFWLFSGGALDDTIAICMIYDGDGHFVRPERAADPRPYQAMRATARAHAMPLQEFLTRHEPRLLG